MNENRRDKQPSHNIDDLFRSSIEPSEESPSASVWEHLEKGLDRTNIIDIKRKYGNFKKIAIAMVLLLSSALVYEYQTHNHNNTTGNNGIENGLANTGKPGNAPLTTGKTNQPEKISSTEDINSSVQNHAYNQDATSSQQPSSSPKITLRSPLTSSGSSSASAEQNVNGRGLRDLTATQSTSTPVNKMGSLQINSNNASASALSNSKTRANGYELLTGKPVDVEAPVAFTQFPSSIAPGKFVVANGASLNVSADLKSYSQSPALKNIGTSAGKSTQAISLSRKKHAFSLSLIFSPDFTSRVVKSDWTINHEDNRDEIRKKERYAFSYSFGAMGEYKLNRHWSIQSGFTVSRETINIQPKFIFARRDDVGDLKYKFNSSWGYSYLSPHTMATTVFGDSLHAFGSTSSLLYVSVPVSVKYSISKKKLDYSVAAGLAANILVKDKIKTSLFRSGSKEEAVNRDIRGPKPVYYSAVISAGATYNLNKTFAVSFTPTARVALTSLNKDAPVRSYQQSLGLVAGAQLNF